MNNYKRIEVCRNCKGAVVDFMNLGKIYPSNFVPNGTENIDKVPLALCTCIVCGLVQLRYTVNLDLMYRKYWYKSGINDEMVLHLQDVVNSIENIMEFKYGDVVVDIGANDGTMLSLYSHPGMIRVGFDPAYNLASEASQKCDYFVNNYFSADYYPLPYRAKVVTAIAMFYDLEDPNKFIEDVISILDEEGIFVIQFADLVSMLETNDFPTICHEHIEYYDLFTIKRMLERHNLRLFKVERNDVNGGSLRLYLDKKVRKVDQSVHEELEYERSIYVPLSLKKFSDRVDDIASTVHIFISNEKQKGKTISILGASTKGNTILQVFDLDNTLIDFAADANKEKWGLKTIGTGIEIQSDEFVFSKNPDYMLILPWFFATNFISKYRDYLENGGMFIIPLPEPTLVTKDRYIPLMGRDSLHDRYF